MYYTTLKRSNTYTTKAYDGSDLIIVYRLLAGPDYVVEVEHHYPKNNVTEKGRLFQGVSLDKANEIFARHTQGI